MCLQWFPYHCSGLADVAGVPVLAFQRFTFDFLRAAIAAGKMVIVMRSEQLWRGSVPELRGAPYTLLRNVRSPFFTPGNMPAGAFERMVAALGSG
jgi:hypothetical protein